VLSGARDPQFGDEATTPKRISCVVKKVDDVIQCFCWEVGIRHRGFRQEVKASALALDRLLIVFPCGVFDGFDLVRFMQD
jgi:hypothetical protein